MREDHSFVEGYLSSEAWWLLRGQGQHLGPSQIASLELDTFWDQAVPSAVVDIPSRSQNR